jgi:hypothetical protein
MAVACSAAVASKTVQPYYVRQLSVSLQYASLKTARIGYFKCDATFSAVAAGAAIFLAGYFSISCKYQ